MSDPDRPQNTKTNRHGCTFLLVLLVVSILFPTALAARFQWKTFSNRAGWTMNYPANWTIASCRSCSDPTSPEVYVDFFPPGGRDSGFVLVEHLADQPSTMTLDEWFTHVKRTDNQNPQLTEQRFTLNGLPALRVRYRNPSDSGYEMESVYTVSRGHTFEIEFSAERSGVSLEALKNYATYLEMVKTFKVKD